MLGVASSSVVVLLGLAKVASPEKAISSLHYLLGGKWSDVNPRKGVILIGVMEVFAGLIYLVSASESATRSGLLIVLLVTLGATGTSVRPNRDPPECGCFGALPVRLKLGWQSSLMAVLLLSGVVISSPPDLVRQPSQVVLFAIILMVPAVGLVIVRRRNLLVVRDGADTR